MSIVKKRNLFTRGTNGFEPEPGDVCLSDITETLGKLSAEASKLELQDNLTSCKKSVKLTFELDKLSKMYRERVRSVRDDIRTGNQNEGRYKGNAETLIKINKAKGEEEEEEEDDEYNN